MTEYECIISDSHNQPLASAILENKPDEKTWRLRILGDNISGVVDHEFIQIVSMNDRVPNVNAEILHYTEPDIITVSPSSELDISIRRELRIPIRFDSFLYSTSSRWKGRAPIVSLDMSCGGIAFYCNQPLRIGEIAELVIPITSQPLLARIQVLRFRPTQFPIPLIAAKFDGITHDEEILIREAVFSQQLHNHSASYGKLKEKILYSETR